MDKLNKKPLIVIVGPTASGKTAMAIDLAKKFDGEIICADSRTIYKGMDIGTAKPTVPEMQGIPHHLLDVVEPNQRFTVVDFQKLANEKIKEIQESGKTPLLVGGSGLYVDSVIFDYDFANTGGERDQLNPRHLSSVAPKKQLKLRPNTLLIGLDPGKTELDLRIEKRVDQMIADGIIKEAQDLSNKYGWTDSINNIYGIAELYHKNIVTEIEFREYLVKKHRNLAKKQRTWFKRNNSIQWVNDLSESIDLVTNFLNK